MNGLASKSPSFDAIAAMAGVFMCLSSAACPLQRSKARDQPGSDSTSIKVYPRQPGSLRDRAANGTIIARNSLAFSGLETISAMT